MYWMGICQLSFRPGSNHVTITDSIHKIQKLIANHQTPHISNRSSLIVIAPHIYPPIRPADPIQILNSVDDRVQALIVILE